MGMKTPCVMHTEAWVHTIHGDTRFHEGTGGYFEKLEGDFILYKFG